MKYTAVTIGPIVKTLMLAHRTKELWAASYFFSSLMEKIIENIKDKNSIILPYPDKKALIKTLDVLPEKIKSAGIFPDRILLQSTDGMFEELQMAVSNALENLETEFGIEAKKESLLKYLYAHIVEFEYSKRENKEDDNIIFQANDYLANCELQATYVAKDDSFFLRMLQNIDTSKVYKQDVFKGEKNFPSIIEIATKGLGHEPAIYNQGKDEEDADIWNRIVDLGENERKRITQIEDKEKQNNELEQCKVHGKLKTAHKYIAIVQADGDNVSEIIKSVANENDSTKILEFSKCLSEFSLFAADKIANYGGLPVYVGGDDLLFFAPVVTSKENIFNLLRKLDTAFEEKVTNKYDGVKPKPSVSYGVSITYYKYPMHEALRAAQSLLFEHAKDGKKNAIAFRVQKHSGQEFGAVLSKRVTGKEDFFDKLLQANQKLALNSVIYNMDKHKVILEKIIADKEKLQNFFNNFYNEKVHNDTRDFFATISELLTDAYTKSKDFDETKNQVYAQLRLIKFLNSINDE